MNWSAVLDTVSETVGRAARAAMEHLVAQLAPAAEYSPLALPPAAFAPRELGADVFDVLAGRARWSLTRGESLWLLRALPEACIDAVIGDSPYSSGGQFRGDRVAPPSEKYVQRGTVLVRPDFTGDTRDQISFEYWSTLWMCEARRVAKIGAPICSFTDWRQVVPTILAMQAGGWIFRGIMPWDKTEGARPAKGRFAQQCEFIVWGSNGPMSDERIGGECLPGIVRHYPNPRHKRHIAGKTKETMCPIVRICERDGVVLDPFAGSASTGVACLVEGRRFIGFELVPQIADEARAWLAAEERGLAPEDAAGGQRSIFDVIAKGAPS